MTRDRFSPEQVLARIEERTGIALEVVAIATMASSGGAVYVRWPDGRDGVLTCPPVPAALMRLTAEILDRARSAGLPVPRHELIVPLASDRTALIQERLPGSAVWDVDTDLIDAMIEVNDRFAGLLQDRPDVPHPTLYVRDEPRNAWLHETLERHDTRTRQLLRRIEQIGETVPDLVAGGDLLHLDYARGNVLSDGRGHITGVVDWNLGVARGDRRLALVCLRSDLEWNALPRNGVDDIHRAAMERLDRVLEERLDPITLRAYWARSTLLMLDGVIRADMPDAVEVFCDLGFQRLA